MERERSVRKKRKKQKYSQQTNRNRNLHFESVRDIVKRKVVKGMQLVSFSSKGCREPFLISDEVPAVRCDADKVTELEKHSSEAVKSGLFGR